MATKKLRIMVSLATVVMIGLLAQALFGAFTPNVKASTSWWPDGNDVASDARATWVYFSGEFTYNWSTTALVDASVLEMRNKKVDVIIASLTSADMTGLSTPSNSRTVLYQRMVDQAASYGMAVYTGFWEDEFSGSSGQMGMYTYVDNVINFNNNNGSSADIVGVVSDYEMHSSNRTATRYDQWRQFHNDLNNRIGSNNLKLIPVLNDPAVLIKNCKTCNATWMAANGIGGANPDYTGDVNFFTSYSGARFADGLIGMYYYSTPATIQSNAHDDIVEANGLSPAASIVVGFSVGTNFDPTLLTEADVNTAVSNNEAERASYPNGTLGVMCWRWDDPTDGDNEYRGVISSEPPGGNPTATPTATQVPTDTPGGPTPTSTNTPVATPTTSGNLALSKPATTSSLQSGYPGANAVDGSLSTYWRSRYNSTLGYEWIDVDLQSSMTVGRVVFKWNNNWATNYTIQVSQNDADWTTVATVTTGDGGEDTVSFTPTAARYVRMYSTAWKDSGQRCRLNEYEIYSQ